MDRRKIMTIQKINHCPVCGGELEEKEVEKLLHGGVHTAILKVRAEVCLHCGESLYSQEVSAFKLLGKAFQVA